MDKKIIQINLRRLIEILGKHLYSRPEVCIRELIQNAHDALLIRTKRRPQITTKLNIKIRADKTRRTLQFSDSGIGMSSEEIDNRLSRIANSIKDDWRTTLDQPNQDLQEVIVGTFGIGFLSSFLVAEKVTVKTRPPNTKNIAHLWSSVGDEYYDTHDEPCSENFWGTEVTLTIKPEFHQFLEENWLKERVRRYCDFITYPIYLNDDSFSVNKCMPPWRDPETVEAEYESYLKRLNPSLDLLGLIPLKWDGRIGGVVGIPKRLTQTSEGMALYNDRFFVCDTKQLLPEGLSLLQGIIDTSGLVLTLSREDYVKNAQATGLKNHLVLKIADGLKKLAANNKQSFQQILQAWGNMIKYASIENDIIFEQLAEFLPMKVGEDYLTLEKLKERARSSGDAERIFYMTDENTQRQYTSLLGQFGHPVVDTTNEIEQGFLQKYAQKKNVNIEAVDMGIASLLEPLTDASWDQVLQAVSAYVQSDSNDSAYSVRMANFKISNIPAIFCTQQDWLSKLGNLTDRSGIPPAVFELLKHLQHETRVLFLNAGHPLLQRLKKLVEQKSTEAPTIMKTKILLIRGLINAAAIHSGRFDPIALNRFLQDAASALQFIAELQLQVHDLEAKLQVAKNT